MTRSHWGIDDVPGLIGEIDRDLRERGESYPGMVDKGRLKAEEADYLLALLGDIRRDLSHAFGPPPWFPPSPQYGWLVKVKWMKAELARREETYPDKVAKGRLSADDAERRTGALRMLVNLYWRQLFAWEPPEPGDALDYWRSLKAANSNGPFPDRDGPGARAYRELVRQHMVTIDNESQQALLVANA